MPIPDYQTLMRRSRDVVPLLADKFGLSEQERKQLLPAGDNR